MSPRLRGLLLVLAAVVVLLAGIGLALWLLTWLQDLPTETPGQTF